MEDSQKNSRKSIQDHWLSVSCPIAFEKAANSSGDKASARRPKSMPQFVAALWSPFESRPCVEKDLRLLRKVFRRDANAVFTKRVSNL